MKTGNWVRIRCRRPHLEQYTWWVGQITCLLDNNLAYVCVGRYTLCFHVDELEMMAGLEGGAA